ncbi:MAG: putative ABC transporter permease [bacterium]|nr:putative ABC transporter permease [bacterium]
MFYEICCVSFLFISYSFIGWILECICCTIEWRKFVCDRGFLIGPYCPIYGFGGVAVYLILSRYYYDPFTLFILAAVGASVLEYVTSYLMEILFKARWWDYSHRRWNLEGRVCLGNSLLFGLLGLAFVYLINPFFLSLIKKLPMHVLMIISCVLITVFLVDLILSCVVMTKLKLRVETIQKDSTSEIDKQVREFLASYRFFVRRIFRAFPKIHISIPSGENIQKVIQDILNSVDKVNPKSKRKGKRK